MPKQAVARLLVIDNYDSFTYNLVQMFMVYPLDIKVFRSDALTVEQVASLAPDYILISPGPKDPAHAGISIPVIKRFYRSRPMLGVCLGMQCLNEVFGGRTGRAPLPVHGKVSRVAHDRRFLFQDVPTPLTVARYHSLMTEHIPPELMITARSEDGVIMGLSHARYPLHGVQFHPESFMTQEGEGIIANFLRMGPYHPDQTAA